MAQGGSVDTVVVVRMKGVGSSSGCLSSLLETTTVTGSSKVMPAMTGLVLISCGGHRKPNV